MRAVKARKKKGGKEKFEARDSPHAYSPPPLSFSNSATDEGRPACGRAGTLIVKTDPFRAVGGRERKRRPSKKKKGTKTRESHLALPSFPGQVRADNDARTRGRSGALRKKRLRTPSQSRSTITTWRGKEKRRGGISWPPAGGTPLCEGRRSTPREPPAGASCASSSSETLQQCEEGQLLASIGVSHAAVGGNVLRRSPRGVSVSFRGQQNEPRGTSIRNSRGGNRARFKATRNHIGRTRNCRSTQPKRGQPTAEGPSFPSKGAPGKTFERSRGISKTLRRERKALFISRLEFTRDSDIATKEARLPSLEFRNPFLER
ncbi:hypothetical protein MRX96_036982 [Rhipicephalus microplus]